MKYKRLSTATILGAILGIFCILGVSQRMPTSPVPNSTIYLVNAWYSRVLMGIIIGLAGEIVILKNNEGSILNPILRGAIIGAIVSVYFAFFGQEISLSYFGAGIMFGVINDVVTTKLVAKWDQ